VRAFCFSVSLFLLGTSSAIAAADYAWWVPATFALGRRGGGIALRDLDRDWLRASVLRRRPTAGTASDPGESVEDHASPCPASLISTVMAARAGCRRRVFKCKSGERGAFS